MAGEKAKGGYSNPISCAVSDQPDGPYMFHGYVKNSDGSPYREKVCFDPAVINDEGTIRIYFGTDIRWTDLIPFSKQKFKVIADLTGRTYEEEQKQNGKIFGAYCAQLEDDMLTLRTVPVRIDEDVKGKEYRKHVFFEASSIRRISGMYYFVYSSLQSHELCLLTSRYPDRDFVYRGTIISNGDIGYKGRKRRDRTNFTGNNHGNIEEISGQFYIFYHRPTNLTDFSRQVCAEKIEIRKDSFIPQVQMTSMGLNNEAIEAEGMFPAGICCSLKRGHMPSSAESFRRKIPYIADDGNEQFIRDIYNGTKIVYRSFHLREDTEIAVTVKGDAGILHVSAGTYGASVNLTASEQWKTYRMCMNQSEGIYELRFTYSGKGKTELLEIGFENS